MYIHNKYCSACDHTTLTWWKCCGHL